MSRTSWFVRSIIVAVALLYASVAFATSDPTPPADWDASYWNSAWMVEGGGALGQWQIVYQGQQQMPTLGLFCVGVVKYKTKASVSGADPNVGWAWAYYATPEPDWGSYTIPPGRTYSCANLRAFAADTQVTPTPMQRPGLLFLHGNGARGSFFEAMFIAYHASNLTGGEVNHQRAFVLAPSAPGQGFDCGTGAPDAGTAECIALGNAQDQISHGPTDAMCDPPQWREGFPGYTGTPDPDHSLLWSNTMSALRAVNVFYRVFDAGSAGNLRLTNGDLIVGGFSIGGTTSLILNGVDTRHDGVFTLAASGALDQAVSRKGNWMLYTLTTDDYSTEPYLPTYPNYSIDCKVIRTNPSAYPVIERQACQVIEYFDPVGFTPHKPSILIAGSQDETFPVNAFQATHAYLAGFSPATYRHHQADMDHGYYWSFFKQLGSYESYGNFDPTYVFEVFTHYGLNKMLRSMKGFFQQVTHSQTPMYAWEPVHIDMEKTVNPNDVTYSVISCWDNTTSPQPYEMRFNISIDSMYHALRACTGMSGSNGLYIVDESLYDYNSVCWTGSQYSQKCTGIDTQDSFLGVSYTNPNFPTNWTCRKFDVQFPTGSTPPNRISAWTDLRYWLNGYPVNVSSEVKTRDGVNWGANVDPMPCARPKEVGNVCQNPEPPMDDILAYYEEQGGAGASMAPGGEGFDAETVDGATCEPLTIDNRIVAESGQTLDFTGFTLAVTANGGIEGEGDIIIQTDCDVVLEPGALIRAADRDGAIGATVTVLARTIEIAGDIDVSGKVHGGQIILLATDGLTVSGNLDAFSDGPDGVGGQIHTSSLGNAYLAGSLDTSAAVFGGVVVVSAEGNVTLGGTALAVGEAANSFGGDITIGSKADLVFESGAYLATSGENTDGHVSLSYCDGFADEGGVIDEASIAWDECVPY